MRIFVLAALAACGRMPAIEAPHDVDDDDIPDDEDRCPDLPSACVPDDADGCPDVAIPARVHLPLRADDRATLAAIAREVPAMRPDALIVVAAPALPNEPPGPALERATAVALRLEEDGAPLARLIARAAPPALDPGYRIDLDCVAPATAPSASR